MGRGRPKKAEADLRDKFLPTRATQEEIDKFTIVCKVKRGLSVSGVIREFMLSEIRKMEKEDPELMEKGLRELRSKKARAAKKE